MTLKRKAAITGIGEVKPTRNPDGKTSLGIMTEVSRLAMLDAGLEPGDVDGLLVAPTMSEMIGMWPAILGEYIGVHPSYSNVVDIGGASAAGMVWRAAAAIAAGQCRAVLCVLAEASDVETFYAPRAKRQVLGWPRRCGSRRHRRSATAARQPLDVVEFDVASLSRWALVHRTFDLHITAQKLTDPDVGSHPDLLACLAPAEHGVRAACIALIRSQQAACEHDGDRRRSGRRSRLLSGRPRRRGRGRGRRGWVGRRCRLRRRPGVELRLDDYVAFVAVVAGEQGIIVREHTGSAEYEAELSAVGRDARRGP